MWQWVHRGQGPCSRHTANRPSCSWAWSHKTLGPHYNCPRNKKDHTRFSILCSSNAHSSLPLRTADISPPMDVAALIRVLALLRHWMSQADSCGHIFRLSPTWKFRISGPLQGGIQCTLMNYLGHSIKTPERQQMSTCCMPNVVLVWGYSCEQNKYPCPQWADVLIKR